jgi:hypothetical protein
MPKQKKVTKTTEDKSICQNCGKTFPDHKLNEIGSGGFWERVQPGDIMPTGECPSCGSLCTPIQKPQTILVAVRGGIAEAVESTIPIGVEVEIIDFDSLEENEKQTLTNLSTEARVWALGNK